MKKPKSKKPNRQLVVITGLSGSGKGSVLRTFEDFGYYCVDHLPVDFIPKFAELCATAGSRIERAAVVVDIREGEALNQFPGIYRSLRRNGFRPSLVFLEASDHALLRRFEETRRPHPLGRDLPVREGIRRERALLRPIRKLADTVIDTTRMNVHELRDFIQARIGAGRNRKNLLVSLLSFGYRFGVPADADLMFDVRFLPNPNFVSQLKGKTGRDRPVREFMDSFPETRQFIDRLMNLLLYLLPSYVREGKTYLTIAIGCTGGRHRSVAVADQVGEILATEGYKIKVSHRDLGRGAV